MALIKNLNEVIIGYKALHVEKSLFNIIIIIIIIIIISALQ